MGEIVTHIVLNFPRYFNAFYDVLHCVLRCFALRFTTKWTAFCEAIGGKTSQKRLRFYMELVAFLYRKACKTRYFTVTSPSLYDALFVDKILIFIKLTLRHLYFKSPKCARACTYIIYAEMDDVAKTQLIVAKWIQLRILKQLYLQALRENPQLTQLKNKDSYGE